MHSPATLLERLATKKPSAELLDRLPAPGDAGEGADARGPEDAA